MIYDKQIRIDKDVPIEEGLVALKNYVQDLDVYPWKRQKHGWGSTTIFGFEGGLHIAVYMTETCYIIRRG